MGYFCCSLNFFLLDEELGVSVEDHVIVGKPLQTLLVQFYSFLVLARGNELLGFLNQLQVC